MLMLLILSALGLGAIAGALHLVHVDGYRQQPVRSAWQDPAEVHSR